MSRLRLRPLVREVGKIGTGEELDVEEGGDHTTLYIDPGLDEPFWQDLLWPGFWGTGPNSRRCPPKAFAPTFLGRAIFRGGQVRTAVACVQLRQERQGVARVFTAARYLVFPAGAGVGPGDVQRHLGERPLRALSLQEVLALDPVAFEMEVGGQPREPVAAAWLREALGWLYDGVPVAIVTDRVETFASLAQAIWSAMPADDRQILSWAWGADISVDRLVEISGGAEARPWAACWYVDQARWEPPSEVRDDAAAFASSRRVRPSDAAVSIASHALDNPEWRGLEVIEEDVRGSARAADGFLEGALRRLRRLAECRGDMALAGEVHTWARHPTGPCPPMPAVSNDARVSAYRSLLDAMREAERRSPPSALPQIETLVWTLLADPSFGARAAWELERAASVRARLVAALWNRRPLSEVLDELREAGLSAFSGSVQVDGELRAEVGGALEAGPRELRDMLVSLVRAFDAGLLLDLRPLVRDRHQEVLVAVLERGGVPPQHWLPLVHHCLPDESAKTLLVALEHGRPDAELVGRLAPWARHAVRLRLCALLATPPGEAGRDRVEALGRLALELPPDEEGRWTVPVGFARPVLCRIAWGDWDAPLGDLAPWLNAGLVPSSLGLHVSAYLLWQVDELLRRISLRETPPRQTLEPAVVPFAEAWPAVWRRRLGMPEQPETHVGEVADPERVIGGRALFALLHFWSDRASELHPDDAAWMWRCLGGVRNWPHDVDSNHAFLRILWRFSQGEPLDRDWPIASAEAPLPVEIFLEKVHQGDPSTFPLLERAYDASRPGVRERLTRHTGIPWSRPRESEVLRDQARGYRPDGGGGTEEGLPRPYARVRPGSADHGAGEEDHPVENHPLISVSDLLYAAVGVVVVLALVGLWLVWGGRWDFGILAWLASP